SLNINKQGKLIWPTTAKVVEFEPGRRIANRVIENTSIWAFELEPTDAGGTRLVERRETPHGTSALSQFLVDKVFGGQPAFTEELGHGVSTSLTRIKALPNRAEPVRRGSSVRSAPTLALLSALAVSASACGLVGDDVDRGEGTPEPPRE